MNILPKNIFLHILGIYSGENTFPGNLACVSKSCQSLCDLFKAKMLQKRIFLRIDIKADHNGKPINTHALIAIQKAQKSVPLPPALLSFLKPKDGLHFRVDEEWKVEKAVVRIVTASKIWKEEIEFDFDEEFGGRFERYNHHPEDVLTEDSEHSGVKNYAITIEPIADEDDDELVQGNVLHFVEWESYFDGVATGEGVSVEEFLQNWDKVILLD